MGPEDWWADQSISSEFSKGILWTPYEKKKKVNKAYLHPRFQGLQIYSSHHRWQETSWSWKATGVQACQRGESKDWGWLQQVIGRPGVRSERCGARGTQHTPHFPHTLGWKQAQTEKKYILDFLMEIHWRHLCKIFRKYAGSGVFLTLSPWKFKKSSYGVPHNCVLGPLHICKHLSTIHAKYFLYILDLHTFVITAELHIKQHMTLLYSCALSAVWWRKKCLMKYWNLHENILLNTQRVPSIHNQGCKQAYPEMCLILPATQSLSHLSQRKPGQTSCSIFTRENGSKTTLLIFLLLPKPPIYRGRGVMGWGWNSRLPKERKKEKKHSCSKINLCM